MKTLKVKSIRLNQIKYMLVSWGNLVSMLARETGLSPSTMTHRLFELGPDGACIRCSAFDGSDYWPESDMVRIDKAVQEINLKDRNILVRKYVYGDNYREIGEKISLTKSAVIKRMPKIEEEIHVLLQ